MSVTSHLLLHSEALHSTPVTYYIPKYKVDIACKMSQVVKTFLRDFLGEYTNFLFAKISDLTGYKALRNEFFKIPGVSTTGASGPRPS